MLADIVANTTHCINCFLCVGRYNRKYEGPDPSGRLRDAPATPDPESTQAAGGVCQQAHRVAPDRGPGGRRGHAGGHGRVVPRREDGTGTHSRGQEGELMGRIGVVDFW